MRGQKKRDRQGKRVEGVPFMSDCGSGESVPREPGRGGVQHQTDFSAAT